MKQFKIRVEVNESKILTKTFAAESLEAAIELAEAEEWEGQNAQGWEYVDGNSFAEVREELCREVK